MKQLFFLFFFIVTCVNAQDFTSVDSKVDAYPRYTQPESLAQKIASDFKDDASRSRAIFKWLTNNIRYNLEEYYRPKQSIRFSYTTEEERLQKLQEIKDKIVKDAFLRKIGVCEEYAQSFKKVADLLGIEAQVIKGYARNSAQEIGRPPRSTNHAWNSVKINGKWILLDATWASGYLYNGKWVKNFNDYFYDVPAKKIGRTHYPDDKKWQIVLDAGTLDAFYDQPIYSQRFLKANLDVLTPTKGIVHVNSGDKISLKIKNLKPTQRLFYNFKGQRYSQRPQITYDGDVATVLIENPGRNSELYLFLNRGLALEYKVLVN